mmetsp:Transcript_8125/g.16375  ORF Transcript_8125/g.16375 Transcript_8125/m.16375 type:complete len:349 (-) Transcript_8125:2141-3187(-)
MKVETLVSRKRGTVSSLHSYTYHSGDGQWRMATGASEGSLSIWKPNSGDCFQSLNGHRDEVTDIVDIDHGQRLVSTSLDETLRVWDWERGTCERIIEPNQKHMYCVAADTKNPHVFLCGGQGEGIKMWDVRSSKLERVIQGKGTSWIWTLAAKDDSKQLISGDGEGVVRLWDTTMPKCERQFKSHSRRVTSVGWVESRREIVSASSDGTIKIWSKDGKCMKYEHNIDHVTCEPCKYEENLNINSIVYSFVVLLSDEKSRTKSQATTLASHNRMTDNSNSIESNDADNSSIIYEVGSPGLQPIKIDDPESIEDSTTERCPADVNHCLYTNRDRKHFGRGGAGQAGTQKN